MLEKITSRQVIYLISINRVVTTITMMSTIRMGPKNQDIWIIIIGSFFYTMVLYSPMLFLSNKFKDISVVKFIEKIFGRTLGKIVSLFYCLYFINIAIQFTYRSIQTIRTLFLPIIPVIIPISVFILACVYLSIKGIEIIGRLAELIGPIVFVAILLLFILGSRGLDLSILLPIYKDSTFSQINAGSLQLFSLFTDGFILTGIMQNLENKEEANKVFVKSVLYSLIIILLSVVFTQCSLGIEQAKHSNFPFFLFVRLIDSHSVFQRIEAIYITMWIACMILRISIYLYLSSDGLKQVLNKKTRKGCIYGVGLLVGAVTYYISNFNPQIETIVNIQAIDYISHLIFSTVIPLIGVIVYFFRRKSMEGKSSKT